jgi:hypothetical protein
MNDEGYDDAGAGVAQGAPEDAASRPNPIAVSVAEIVSVEPPRLYLRGLDAWTGSPVLDIKPYDFYDIVRSPRVPDWFLRRWRELRRRRRYEEVAPWLGPCREPEE